MRRVGRTTLNQSAIRRLSRSGPVASRLIQRDRVPRGCLKRYDRYDQMQPPG